MSQVTSLGATPTGSDWCLKALHPSDPLVEVRGIPDRSAAPTTFINYQTVTNITAPDFEGATDADLWSFDASLIPHPVGFMAGSSDRHNYPGGVSTFWEILNSQLTGASHLAKYSEFRELANKWRLAYMSVTIFQDGPDLANQGSIVACQVPVDPIETSLSGRLTSVPPPPVDGVIYGVDNLQSCKRICSLRYVDRPDFEVSQAMPNAYFSRSKDGLYMPLKLTKTCQKWHGVHDEMCIGRVGENPNQDLQFFSPSNGVVTLERSDTTGIADWPFLSLERAGGEVETPSRPDYDAGVPGNEYSVLQGGTLQLWPVTTITGESTSAFCNDVWGQISVRNVSPLTSFSVFVRAGFEVQVLPQSALSPYLRLSPPHDALSLDMYYKVARELKDAFPADFNITGKLWDTIKSVASRLRPFAHAISPLLDGMTGVPISTAALAAAEAYLSKNRIKGGKPGQSRGAAASAADRERAQEIRASRQRAPQQALPQGNGKPVGSGRFKINRRG